MSLVEFLLARVTEEEVVAARLRAYRGRLEVTHWPSKNKGPWCVADYDPARVLAECKAKRQIIELHPEESLRILAAVYVDHPDYDEDWRP